jgi:hypothetical protein
VAAPWKEYEHIQSVILGTIYTHYPEGWRHINRRMSDEITNLSAFMYQQVQIWSVLMVNCKQSSMNNYSSYNTFH